MINRMRIILLSVIPGAAIAAIFDAIMPSLSSSGFIYITIAGMIFFVLLSHILSALFGYKKEDRIPFEREPRLFPL